MTLGLSEAGKEVLAGWGSMGGDVVCGGSPWVFLPLPLLLFFLGAPAAEDTALDGLPALWEEAGLTNDQHFHVICC